jgi:ribosomal protein S18 acetylase RimI-like enzyme
MPTSISVLSSTDSLASLADAIAVVFQHDDLTIALGDDWDAMVKWGNEVAPACLPDKLTIIATDTDTHQVVGFATVREVTHYLQEIDAALALDDTLAVEHLVRQPLLARIATLEQQQQQHRASPGGIPTSDNVPLAALPYVYLELLGVRPSHQRQGLARKMIDAVIDHATQRGFERLFVLATSIASQTLLRNYTRTDFTQVQEIAYGEFDVHGCKPFASIQQPSSARFFECLLCREQVKGQ